MQSDTIANSMLRTRAGRYILIAGPWTAMGGGMFRDVSVGSGIAAHVGKGMGLAISDFDGNGGSLIFSQKTNDTRSRNAWANDYRYYSENFSG